MLKQKKPAPPKPRSGTALAAKMRTGGTMQLEEEKRQSNKCPLCEEHHTIENCPEIVEEIDYAGL